MAESTRMIAENAEDYYKIIVESSFNGIAVTDEQGNFEYVNESFLKMVGWPKEELIGQNFIKIIPEDLHESANKLCGEVQEEANNSQEIKIKTRNGELKYLKSLHKLAKINGKLKTVSITEDVTKKNSMEQKLKESEAKYRELFENAQDAMYVLDIKGNFLKLNEVGLRILACTKDEVIGTNISKWLTQGSLKIVEERRKKWKSGQIVEIADTLELVGKNGEHRWVEIKTRHIKDGGRIIEFHGIARDVTENIMLKQKLNNSNKQRKLLCYLIKGTRGGKTRTLMLKYLTDRSYNANQLAKVLNMDYKTIRHHLGVLAKNEIITKDNNGGSAVYFISKNIQSDLNEFNSELPYNKG